MAALANCVSATASPARSCGSAGSQSTSFAVVAASIAGHSRRVRASIVSNGAGTGPDGSGAARQYGSNHTTSVGASLTGASGTGPATTPYDRRCSTSEAYVLYSNSRVGEKSVPKTCSRSVATPSNAVESRPSS